MSIRARLTALLLGASAPARTPGRDRATTTIIDGLVTPERRAKLIEDGRREVDNIVARTRVERAGHFDAPRFGA